MSLSSGARAIPASRWPRTRALGNGWLIPVLDGDTISIREQHIRIAAIDACELDQTGLKDGQTWRCGVIARSYLRKMIDGQHVRCEIIDQDRYRRLVGQCFIGDTDVGLAMVNAGLAEAMLQYLPSSHPISLVEYGEAENRARGNGLGIWSAERSKVRISIAAPSPQRCLNRR